MKQANQGISRRRVRGRRMVAMLGVAENYEKAAHAPIAWAVLGFYRRHSEMDEINFIAILFTLVNLLIAMWVPLTSGSGGVEAKRVLAWCALVTATLIIPSMLLTWSVMQISARVLVTSVTNLSSFVSQIAWTVGAFSALYPLIWGIKLYPYLELYVSKLLSSANDAEIDSQSDKKIKKGESES